MALHQPQSGQPRDGGFIDQTVDAQARGQLLGVNATYRLAPKHQWPAGAQDVGASARWVRANIAAYGGDPNRIVLMGHSAGASHVAGYLVHKQLQPADGDGVIGAILLSGGTIRPPK